MVNGREYTKRLRQQFERLYPVPEWANPPPRRKSKKRRRISNDSVESDTDRSASDMSVDSEELSAPPLSKLLQNTGSFLQNPSTSSPSRRKLRPEVIDVQRSKDVGGAQPASPNPHSNNRFSTNEPPVRYNIPYLPSLPPSPPILRPRLDALSPPHLAAPTAPQPPPHIPPHPPHPHLNLDLHTHLRLQDLLLRPPPLLPHLGPLLRQNRENLPHPRRPGPTAKHGALQAQSLRAMDRPRRLRAQRRRRDQHPQHHHKPMGRRGARRGQRRRRGFRMVGRRRGHDRSRQRRRSHRMVRA